MARPTKYSEQTHKVICDAIIRHNFAFVREVCKVIKHKEHFTDACQYCVEGFIRPIEKWEPERGLRPVYRSISERVRRIFEHV